MSRKKLFLPAAIAVVLLVLFAIGSWYFVNQILNPPIEKFGTNQNQPTIPTFPTNNTGTTSPTSSGEPSSSIYEPPSPTTTTIGEAQFSFPYPVSWQGTNRANFSLIGASIIESNQGGYTLNLFFKINTIGGFCYSAPDSFPIRRLINEEGDLALPDAAPMGCFNGNAALYDKKAVFNIPDLEKEIVIQVMDQSGQMQTFFTIRLSDTNELKVEPAPAAG